MMVEMVMVVAQVVSIEEKQLIMKVMLMDKMYTMQDKIGKERGMKSGSVFVLPWHAKVHVLNAPPQKLLLIQVWKDIPLQNV